MSDWTSDIQRDLKPFADPGTRLQCALSDNWFTVTWTSRRRQLTASFSNRDQDIITSFEGRELTYRSFLSSALMSDLLGLAGMILQIPSAPIYIDTRASLDQTAGSEQPALSLLQSSVDPTRVDATSVLFITGDAGAGKTEVLRQLVKRQAELYLQGQTDYLFLYVNAQGRALARLDEALATEIQDLRASNLTYHVVPTLTRNGILVPLIDGFDELLGVLGYEDSFSSLRRFLDDLDGRGCIIASARSTYYQQEFISRSGRAGFSEQRIEADQIKIHPWGDTQFRDYIDARFSHEGLPSLTFDDFKDQMISAFQRSENSGLREKPFFVAKTADIILKGISISGDDLVDQLVDGYIERERTEKLLDRNHAPLLTSDNIKAFVRSVAEEMWMTETRSLDSETIRILAELLLSNEQISSEAGNVIRERATTMAFFSPASGRERIEFEHELFMAFFLGDIVGSSFASGRDALYNILSRGVLPEYTTGFAATRIHSAGFALTDSIQLAGKISQVSGQRNHQVRENAGDLAFALLKEFSKHQDQQFQGLVLSNLTFTGNSFPEWTWQDCSLKNIEFRRTDLSSAKFVHCHADQVGLHEIIIDPQTTRMELNGIDVARDVYGLKVRERNNVSQTFRIDKMSEILRSCGTPVPTSAAPMHTSTRALELLERVLRKFERATLFWPSDDVNRNISGDEDWPSMERLLIETKIVAREDSLHHKGSPRSALRRNYLPQQIMLGAIQPSNVPEEIRKFWSEFASVFPT